MNHQPVGPCASPLRSNGIGANNGIIESDPARDRVLVVGHTHRLPMRGLLSRLASLMPVEFVENCGSSTPAVGLVKAVFDLGQPGSPPCPEWARALPRFTASGRVAFDRAARVSTIEVQFSADAQVPFPFRGRRVTGDCRQVPAPLTLAPFERALASGPTGVTWAVSERAGTRHYRSAMPILDVGTEDEVAKETDSASNSGAERPQATGFDEIFNGDRFLENLPFLHFLGTELPACAFENAPLRAAFIFDDPNLHWPKYGFIDFRAMAERARKENFHVAFATIPLDAWYLHHPTAAIFRKHSAQLSLLVHGNNHSKRELAQVMDQNSGTGLAQHALARIERLESRSGINVCRVMVPPHGACSDTMLGCLTGAGFDAACISSGSLRHHNPGRAWGATLGFHPAELINGIPVLPRWSFEGNVENTLLVAAYLGRPLILRGHHQDLRQGYELLDRLARFINGLGPVIWAPLGELARMSFRRRLEAGLCRVVSHGKQVRMTLPDEATHLLIESGNGLSADTEFLVFQGSAPQQTRTGTRIGLTAGTGRTIDIARIDTALPTPGPLAWPATAAKVVLRRFLTESRDRLLPHKL